MIPPSKDRAGWSPVPNDDVALAAVSDCLFEYAPDATLLVDENGRILRANPQAALIFGYAHGELLGLGIEALIPSRLMSKHAELRSRYGEAPRTRRMGTGLDLHACRRDGSEFPVEVALGPVRAGDAALVLCIVRDITERRQTEQALRRAHEGLEQRVAERTADLSRANLMLAQYAMQLELRVRELQSSAFVASHDLQEPLRKIQAFREVALSSILREVIADLEVRSKQLGVSIDAGPLPRVHGDPIQLRQLFQNLIGNALKFRHPDRALSVKIYARPRPLAEGKRTGVVDVCVSDNGIGFDPLHAERIFGLFQRLHGRGEYEGSGLGLAIARRIAERHGGTCTAVGSPGDGATFTVTLPLYPSGLELPT